MVVHHPGYENKIFMVMADSVEMGGDISKELKVAFRGQMKDYPKSKLKELIPFPGGKPIDTDIDDMSLLNEYGKFGTLEGLMEAFTSGNFGSLHEVESKIGKTTQDHIDECGDIKVLGLKEYDELV